MHKCPLKGGIAAPPGAPTEQPETRKGTAAHPSKEILPDRAGILLDARLLTCYTLLVWFVFGLRPEFGYLQFRRMPKEIWRAWNAL